VGAAVSSVAQILKTTNGGQTWLLQPSGTANALNGVACTSATTCVAVGASGTARITTDGSTWSAGTTGTTQALNGVVCTSPTACLAVGAAGTVIASADGGATWSSKTSGTTVALNAIACPAGACYATGAVSSGAAVLLKSTDGGATWTPQASSTANPLSGIACVDSSNCFADGTYGTVVGTTDGGATWTARGNPLGGPTTALNATSIALNGAACTSARCVIGTGAQGDIMTTPLLHVTVHTSSQYGTAPNLAGLLPSNSALSYDPAGEAANVTGTLTCTTTATNASAVGSYPISGCNGLADPGFSVVYDYAGSSHAVVKATLTVTADNKTKVLNAPNPVFTFQITGFQNGETAAVLTTQPTCASPATQTSPVGKYAITCSGGVAGNYNFTYVNGTLTIIYNFAGFFQPVDNLPTLNSANSGQAIPLKWRITDANGNPVTNLTSVVVTAETLTCPLGTTPDQVEEYATGNSGLQNQGNGYYQFNWKTPKTYANSCKTMKLDLGEGPGMERTALFQFPK
jgi:photosystem II stability/assembly factor-like uncharacterized protein